MRIVKNNQFYLFQKSKETISIKNIFILPTTNFLEKNIDLKNRKNIGDRELRKNSEFLEKILLDFWC